MCIGECVSHADHGGMVHAPMKKASAGQASPGDVRATSSARACAETVLCVLGQRLWPGGTLSPTPAWGGVCPIAFVEPVRDRGWVTHPLPVSAGSGRARMAERTSTPQ